MATALKPASSKPLLTVLHLDLTHIEAGVPLKALTDFSTTSGIPMKDIYDVVIPARTLKHRRERKQSLTRDESDKLARLVRVFDYALKVFGEKTKALSWFNSPKRRFNGRAPVAMVQTEIGGRLVEEMLGQIDYGIFA
jgi:putative toxin-antitoxin system antitoxin component (TIGR02293 family)